MASRCSSVKAASALRIASVSSRARIPDPGSGSVPGRSNTASRSACSLRVRAWSITAFLASLKSQPPKGMPRAS